MTDYEKVMKGLECCDLDGTCYNEQCPYGHDLNCHELLKAGLFSLLKKQEPIKPVVKGDKNGSTWFYACGHEACGKPIDFCDKYCRSCGKEVKWDG